MRDDLHKGAPVSPRWRSFIKICSREADWFSSGPRRAEAALVSDLQRELSTNFIGSLGVISTSNQSTLLLAPVVQPHVRTQLDGLIVNHLSCAPHYAQASELISNAVVDALNDWGARMLRSIESHVQEKSPKDRPELMRRMKDILDQLSLSDIAREVAAGRYPKHSRKRIAPVDLDEGLPLGAAAAGLN